MLGGADNPNGELLSYITGADIIQYGIFYQQPQPLFKCLVSRR